MCEDKDGEGMLQKYILQMLSFKQSLKKKQR